MKKVKLFRSKHDICQYGGYVISSLLLDKFSVIDGVVDAVLPKVAHNAIPTSSCVRTMCAIILTSKPDFSTVNELKNDSSFLVVHDNEPVPSEETLRQTLDQLAIAETDSSKVRSLTAVLNNFYERKDPMTSLQVMSALSTDFLRKAKVTVTANKDGFIPIDVDVFTMDNSGSHKEGVSWTYAKFDGYSPIAAYLGEEGWAIDLELRPGSQHCQKDTRNWLDMVIHRSRLLTPENARLLVRMDSGNDSGENIALCKARKVDYIIKKNWRGQKGKASEELQNEATAEKAWVGETRKHLDLVTGHQSEELVREVAIIREETKVSSNGFAYNTSVVHRITREYFDHETGQPLLLPEVEIDSWYTSLSTMNPKTVIRLYEEHGTSEQFHSELKTDLNIERLPSGKFATNKLFLYLVALMYNVIRHSGIEAEKDGSRLAKHKANRRRIRTVLKEVFDVPVQVIRHARQMFFSFGARCRRFEWILSAFKSIEAVPTS